MEPAPEEKMNDKDKIAPRSLIHDGFAYIRKNITAKFVVFYCRHHRSCDCKAQLRLEIDSSGTANIAKSLVEKAHARQCCFKNGFSEAEIADYDWDGKNCFAELKPSDANCSSFPSNISDCSSSRRSSSGSDLGCPRSSSSTDLVDCRVNSSDESPSPSKVRVVEAPAPSFDEGHKEAIPSPPCYVTPSRKG